MNIPCPEGHSYLPYQVEAIKYALGRQDCLIADEMGLGKLLPVDTCLLTPEGWKFIGNTAVGDLVIGSSGRSCTVTGVFPQGIRQTYRVSFSDGSSVLAGDEHLWTVAYRKDGRRVWSELVLTTNQLRERPTIGRLDLSKTVLYLPMLSGPVRFEEAKDLPLHPYLIGALLANGGMTRCSTPMLTVNTNDFEEILILIKNNVGSVRTYGNTTQISVIGVAESCRDIGINGVLSKHKRIPEVCLRASPKDRIALMQGMMDGDGSCSKTNNRLVYHTTSGGLADDFVELVEGLGGIASVRTYDRSHEGKPNEYQVRLRLPTWAPPFRIRRKADRYSPGSHALPCRTVRSVEYVGERDSVCIAVDAIDRLYVTEHCILTHNTVEAIGVANALKPRRTLIVCPASLRGLWHEEWTKWQCYGSRSAVVDRVWPSAVFRTDSAPTAAIVSYDRLSRWSGPAIVWDMLVCDEAHYLKSGTSKRTKAVLGDRRKKVAGIQAARRLFLTGTPIVNDPIDIMPLVRAISPADASSVYGMVSYGRLADLNRYLTGAFMIRRRKADVLKELPPKRRQIVPLPTKLDLKHEAQAINEALATMPHESAVQAMARWRAETAQHIMVARHETALAKVEDVIDHTYSALANTEKVVLFAHHRDVISRISEAMNGVAVTLSGETPADERMEAVKRFQTDRRCRVFIGSIMASGLGITLTAASTVLFAELAWTPAAQQQAEDRLHRKGQHNPVLVQHLVVDGSIDSMMSRLLLKKQDMIDRAIDGDYQKSIIGDVIRSIKS